VDRAAKSQVNASTGRILGLLSLAALLACLLTSLASSTTEDVHSIAARVDRHYNALHALQAQFTETFRGNGMDRTESGTLWIRRPGRMRWEYREPRTKLFVTDGKTAWFYSPGERQARRTAFKSLEDLRSPLAYLLGRAKLEKELNGLSLAPDVTPKSSGNIMLRGVPRGMGGRVAQVLLEITPEGRIDRIVAEGQDDAVTEFRFSESKENGAVDAALIDDLHFRFTPPKGVEVVDGGLEQ
jgi:outer membrane lipoprotein carrier protein